MSEDFLERSKTYLSIYKDLKDKYKRKFIIINLVSSIEEISKYIYYELLKKCLVNNIIEAQITYGIQAMREICDNTSKDVSALNQKHEFKYQFFLFISSYLSQRNFPPERLEEQAKEISSIRSQYLSGGVKSDNENKLLELSDKLERDLEQVIGALGDLDNISVDGCIKILEMWHDLS